MTCRAAPAEDSSAGTTTSVRCASSTGSQVVESGQFARREYPTGDAVGDVQRKVAHGNEARAQDDAQGSQGCTPPRDDDRRQAVQAARAVKTERSPQ